MPDQTERTCENCSTIDEYVTPRQTPSGRRTLCTDCFINILSKTRLSMRESEVYAYSDSGFTNEDTAMELDITASTVASHLASVRKKFTDAIQLTHIIEPSSAASDNRRTEFTGNPPRGLDPGAVIKYTEPVSPDSHTNQEFTHGIIRRVLTRTTNGIPSRVATYAISPDAGSIHMHSPTEMPSVIDKHADSTTVQFPTNVLLKDLNVQD